MFKNKSSKSVEKPSRITNDTIAEHRQKILAGGRRFKYPVQYARHKLVFNTILISIVALVLITIFGWWQLYVVQNTNTLFYRITKVLPLPVAYVDDQSVRYSDYLMRYRGSLHYLQQKEQINLKTDDGVREMLYRKQQAMDDVIADAYALKLSSSLGVTVDDEELESFLKLQRQSGDSEKEVSQETYDAVILDYYNWSSDEYRHVMESKLIHQKVAYQLDDRANEQVLAVADKIKNSSMSFQDIVSSFGGESNITYGASGWVPKTNQDGGLAAIARNLNTGGVSDVVKPTTGDGYYYLKLIDSNSTKISYEYIHIPLTEFTSQLNKIKEDNKVNQLIKIDDVDLEYNQ